MAFNDAIIIFVSRKTNERKQIDSNVKRESELKSAFLKEMKRQLPSFVVLNHEDVREGGHPDKSIIGNGMTSWFEFKHATPKFESPDPQWRTCRRIERQGFCRYVIWWEGGRNQKTLIVRPGLLSTSGSNLSLLDIDQIEESTVGFDMDWLCKYVRRVHLGEVKR